MSSSSIIHQQTGTCGNTLDHRLLRNPFVWPDVYSQHCKENDIEPLGKLRETSQMLIKENKALFQQLLEMNILIGGSESVQEHRLFVSPVS